MELGLKNRVALVAAASQGIGYACALDLAREGARVFLCSRNAERASQAARKIHEETGATVDNASRILSRRLRATTDTATGA